MGFQTQVNIQTAAGVQGDLYDNSPVRSAPWELESDSAAYNVVGATAFTAVTADPGTADVSGSAKAGGTGQFIGILSNLKVYATAGSGGDALAPTVVLPNASIGEMITMAHLWVALPGPANPGDGVSFDQTTGKLSTYKKLAAFVASIENSTGLMTVASVTAGTAPLQPGMILQGVGVTGVTITDYGSGHGGAGTYQTNFPANSADITSVAMTAVGLPVPGAVATGDIDVTGLLTVSAVSSGELSIGSVLYGANVPENTTIVSLGSGTGNTGTYHVSPVPAVAVTSTTITADPQVAIPRAEVILFAPAGNGGLGAISLSNQ